MKTTIPLILTILLAASSCRPLSSGPDFSEDGFSVTARAGHLTLRNESALVIHYVALENETSARVDLYHDPEQWPSLAPGAEERMPYEELMGYEPGATRARVYWWTGGEYQRHIVLDLE